MIPQKTLEELLKRVEKPGRYIGHEKNCVYKNIEIFLFYLVPSEHFVEACKCFGGLGKEYYARYG